jgi:hypothetical protein
MKPPTVTIHPGAPDYSDSFAQREEPRSSSQQQPLKKYADLCITVGDIDYLVDFNVSGPAHNLLTEASLTTGYLARRGEDRKVNEVLRHFHVPQAQTRRLVPFVLEATGTFGQRATTFLHTIIKTIPNSNSNNTGLHPSSNPDDDPINNTNNNNTDLEFVGFHSDLIWRSKECISAAVHRKNSTMIRDYLRRMIAP